MFSDLVVGYLFCGGAGAGACVLLSVLGLLVPRNRVSAVRMSATGRRAVAVFRAPDEYRLLMAPAFAVACGLVALGALLLLADLGVTGRAQLLLAYPSLTFITVGAFALALLLVTSFMLALAWGVPSVRWQRWGVFVLHWAAFALGLTVAVYTGLLLASMPAVPFWASFWLPGLFVLSALSCGRAVVIACAGFSGALGAFATVCARMTRVDAAIIVAEVAVLVGLLMNAAASPYDAAGRAVEALVSGRYAAIFYGGIVVVGIVLPLALEGWSLVARKQTAARAIVASAGVLVGGFALRYCIVAVGTHPEVWTIVA